MVRFIQIKAPLLAALACLVLPSLAAGQDAMDLGGITGQDPNQGQKATVELLVPATSVQPGQKLQVGIKFTMAPGWHIYWKNPGDSGMSPTFRWTLPGGGAARMMRGSEWSATEPQFPVPVRWEDMGIVGYGYAGTVVFPAEVTVPASTTPGQTVELGVLVDYMICKEICLTEHASAKVELTVAAGSAESEEVAEAARSLKAAREALPATAEAEVDWTDGGLVLRVPVPPGAKNVQAFPNPPDGMVVDGIDVTTDGGRATATIQIRRMAGHEVRDAQFEVVFGYDTNQGRRGVSVMVPTGPQEGAAGAAVD